MFDLDREVDLWSRDFAGNTCGREDRVEELKDHLYCEIESNVEEGLSEESAFLAATRRFGISEDLKAEFRKGRGITSILCDAEEKTSSLNLSTGQIIIATVAYLVVFAVLTFTLSYLLRGKELFVYLTPFLFVLFLVPAYFAVGDANRLRSECAFFKRLVKKVF